MNKMKIQLDDLREKNKTISLKSDNLAEELKTADEKIHHNKYNISSMRRTLNEKDQEYGRLKDQIYTLEKFGEDKERMEKKTMEFHKQNENLKKELE